MVFPPHQTFGPSSSNVFATSTMTPSSAYNPGSSSMHYYRQ